MRPLVKPKPLKASLIKRESLKKKKSNPDGRSALIGKGYVSCNKIACRGNPGVESPGRDHLRYYNFNGFS